MRDGNKRYHTSYSEGDPLDTKIHLLNSQVFRYEQAMDKKTPSFIQQKNNFKKNEIEEKLNDLRYKYLMKKKESDVDSKNTFKEGVLLNILQNNLPQGEMLKIKPFHKKTDLRQSDIDLNELNKNAFKSLNKTEEHRRQALFNAQKNYFKIKSDILKKEQKEESISFLGKVCGSIGGFFKGIYNCFANCFRAQGEESPKKEESSQENSSSKKNWWERNFSCTGSNSK